MIIDNKYTRWYYRIIDRATTRRLDGYSERHHIIPKSLGGSNKKDNLVRLTAREHFICHVLLVKMTAGENKKKMSYALWLIVNMTNNHQSRHKVTSITYERIRTYHSTMLSKEYSGKKKSYSSFAGKKHSIETLSHLREVKLGKNNPNFGVVQKPEWNKAKSDSQIGIPKPRFICDGCGKSIGGHGNLSRHKKSCLKIKEIS